MSGFEVVALIGTTIGIIEVIPKIYQAIKDRKGLPKAFEEVNNKLPLIEETLKLVKSHSEDPNVDSDESIKSTVRGCQDRATELKKIFEKIRDAKTSNSKPIKKWYRSIVLPLGQDHRVEELMKNILVDVQSLSNNQVFKAATRNQVQDLQKDLQKAIEELAQLEPSVPDDLFKSPASAGINVYGDGPVHGGHGDVNYATRSGVVNKADKIYNKYVREDDTSDSE
jgi:hypothetical protein